MMYTYNNMVYTTTTDHITMTPGTHVTMQPQPDHMTVIDENLAYFPEEAFTDLTDDVVDVQQVQLIVQH